MLLKQTVLVVDWAPWTEKCLYLNRHYEALLINWQSTNCNGWDNRNVQNNLKITFDRLPWLSVNCLKGGCIQELETHTHKQFQFLFSSETRGLTGLALLWACICVFGRAKHMQIIYIWFLGGIVRIRVKAEPRTSVLGSQVSGEINNKSALNKSGQPVAKGNKVENSNKDTWWLVPWLCVLGHNKGLV